MIFKRVLVFVVVVAECLAFIERRDEVRNANSYMQKELQKEAAKNGDVVNSAISSENVTETPVT